MTSARIMLTFVGERETGVYNQTDAQPCSVPYRTASRRIECGIAQGAWSSSLSPGAIELRREP
jgi:hypothetical protein